MAFTDPQSVTIAGTASSLPRISSTGSSSRYANADESIVLTISHSGTAKRKRRLVRLDVTKITSDPYVPAQNTRVSNSVYLVIDQPLAGFTPADEVAQVAALASWLTASTNANATKVAGGES